MYVYCLGDVVLLLKSVQGGGLCKMFGLFKCTYFMDGPSLISRVFYMTKESRQISISWERKEFLRWNKKHFSLFLKGFHSLHKFLGRWKPDFNDLLTTVILSNWIFSSFSQNKCYLKWFFSSLAIQNCLKFKSSKLPNRNQNLQNNRPQCFKVHHKAMIRSSHCFMS